MTTTELLDRMDVTSLDYRVFKQHCEEDKLFLLYTANEIRNTYSQFAKYTNKCIQQHLGNAKKAMKKHLASSRQMNRESKY